MPFGSPSRGTLPLGFLQADATVTPASFAHDLAASNTIGQYAGFALVVADVQRTALGTLEPRVGFVAKKPPGSSEQRCYLDLSPRGPGLFAVTNDGHLHWHAGACSPRDQLAPEAKFAPKCRRGLAHLEALLLGPCLKEAALVEGLLDRLLHDDSRDDRFVRAAERAQAEDPSPIFYTFSNWHTESSTLVLFRRNGSVLYVERSFDGTADHTGDLTFNRMIQHQLPHSKL